MQSIESVAEEMVGHFIDEESKGKVVTLDRIHKRCMMYADDMVPHNGYDIAFLFIICVTTMLILS